MTKSKQRWTEIENLIAEHKAELKGVTSHRELNSFAEKHSLMTKEDFPKFKHCLLKIGVRYDQLRAVAVEEFEAILHARAKELEKVTDGPTVCLWSGAVEERTAAAFAVVDFDDVPVWYGKFFDDDRVRVAGDLISAEQSAADKAVWLAHKALEAAGRKQGRVLITTTCPDLDIAALRVTGARFNLGVEVHVDDTDLRAVEMAEAPGYKRWQDNDLADLVEDA